ncbi:DUF488 family protein [Caenispirillum bisanense]|uniref:DUF488 domain-containing protein n=1 Tax=Caenispirillum bisanense TaxID=414052 RepID=UPI003CD06440
MTIGYEGASLSDFIATLQTSAVEVVVDIRELAISRRKGFSKKALSSALLEAGLRYLHLPELGDPKAGREAARAGHQDEFRRIYSAHLECDAAQAGLVAVAEMLPSHAVCLLCYEREPLHCHRSLVAAALSDILPLRVRHLGVKNRLGRTDAVRTRESAGAREGIASRQPYRRDGVLRGGH